MKKQIIVLCTIFILMISVGFVIAGQKDKAQKPNKFILPKNAMEVAPGVFYLGKALDKGQLVEGYAFIIKDKKEFARATCGDGKCHPKETNTCPADCGEVSDPNPDPEEPDTSSCYTFLAEGAKWKSVEPYIFDTDNGEGLNAQVIKNNLALDIGKWESATGGYDILGVGTTGDVDGNTIGQLNNKNEVMFGDIDPDNAIGVTIVWGVFSSPLNRRVLVEWDMMFDDVDFDWGMDESDKMDFENIATHELGHAIGMGDLYTAECDTQTMYGYSTEGETSKRDLADGDIAGINILY
ncbi:MAG: matrixin family metalloprotease [Nanoarchaeota archaeon]|nr:matrixin family metalloprotease [Nanoarchaeota archaeon]MBU4116469.1 matrixin family metalloprotease [Nanoarchaeota archaeon]